MKPDLSIVPNRPDALQNHGSLAAAIKVPSEAAPSEVPLPTDGQSTSADQVGAVPSAKDLPGMLKPVECRLP